MSLVQELYTGREMQMIIIIIFIFSSIEEIYFKNTIADDQATSSAHK